MTIPVSLLAVMSDTVYFEIIIIYAELKVFVAAVMRYITTYTLIYK